MPKSNVVLPENDAGMNPETLHRTFHASFNAAYKSDISEIQTELNKEFRVIQCQPFYKNYGGVFYGKYEDLAGYVIQTDNEIMVTYRGTHTYYDMFRDLQANTEKMICGDHEFEVHRGFKLDYLSSKDSLNTVIDAIQSKQNPEPVVFTGHSLGGAVAQLAAVDYLAQAGGNSNTFKAVFTFGSPRVFQQAGAAIYDRLTSKKTLHVMVSGDPVTGVPPTTLGYVHTGRYVNLKTNFVIRTHFAGAYNEVVNQLKGLNNTFEESGIKEKINQVNSWFSFASYLRTLPDPKTFWNYLISLSKNSIQFDKLSGNKKEQEDSTIELQGFNPSATKNNAVAEYKKQLHTLKETQPESPDPAQAIPSSLRTNPGPS